MRCPKKFVTHCFVLNATEDILRNVSYPFIRLILIWMILDGQLSFLLSGYSWFALLIRDKI